MRFVRNLNPQKIRIVDQLGMKSIKRANLIRLIMLRRKPLELIRQQAGESEVHRVYDLKSLLAVGVGGTIGSGIFVLSGTISHSAAGPATAISWLLGGLICLVTAFAYAELSCIVPSSGSTYSFSFFGLGEVFAVYGAWFLTLEYGVAGAAVARSWGNKLAFYLSELEILGCSRGQSVCWVNSLGGSTVNVAAGFICMLTVFILLRGVNIGRVTLNILVILKVALVLFVIIVGVQYYDPDNVQPFLPEPNPETKFVGGWHGVFLGSTIAFFGFIGFDEVACLTMEATSPRRDIPTAIVGTIVIVTILYVCASFVLVGMVPYAEIDEDEGFGSAFRYVGAEWAMHLVMTGQILVVLPAVVLVSFLPQSRLQSALAVDGIFPKAFARMDSNGTLYFGTMTSGIFMALIALFVPFHDLNDLISGGILLSFILTNASLMVIRGNHATWCMRTVGFFVLSSAGVAFSVTHTDKIYIPIIFGIISLVLLGVLVKLTRIPPTVQTEDFKVPGVPFVPALSIQANWFLISQLGSRGLLQVVILLIAIFVIYLFYRVYNYAYADHTLLSRDEEEQSPTSSRPGTAAAAVVEIELN